jgi:hypothetical protein
MKELKVFTYSSAENISEKLHSECAELNTERLFSCRSLEGLLEIAPYSNYDVIIVEVEDSVRNAKSFIKHLRRHGSGREVKIILLTRHKPQAVRNADKADAFVHPDHFKLLPVLMRHYDRSTGKSEKRLFRRFPRHKTVKVDPDSNGIDRVVDVSLSGIGFESHFSFSIGSRLRLNVKAWGSREFRPVEGTIVRREMRPDGIFYGLKFHEPLLPPQEAVKKGNLFEEIISVPVLNGEDKEREFAFICELQRLIEIKSSVIVDFQGARYVPSNILGNILHHLNHSSVRFTFRNLGLSLYHELKMVLGGDLGKYYSEKPSEDFPAFLN